MRVNAGRMEIVGFIRICLLLQSKSKVFLCVGYCFKYLYILVYLILISLRQRFFFYFYFIEEEIEVYICLRLFIYNGQGQYLIQEVWVLRLCFDFLFRIVFRSGEKAVSVCVYIKESFVFFFGVIEWSF